MKYPFKTNQQPDLPPFETLAFAGGGGNPTQGNGRIGTDSNYRTLRDTESGGRSTVFIRGGAGDDLMIGGVASVVLSGEDGAGILDGGEGNDHDTWAQRPRPIAGRCW